MIFNPAKSHPITYGQHPDSHQSYPQIEREKKNRLLRPRRIRKPLMIRHNLLYIKRILLHLHKIPHIPKHALHNTIVIRFSLELGAHELLHQIACLGRVVGLFHELVTHRGRGFGWLPPAGGIGTHAIVYCTKL